MCITLKYSYGIFWKAIVTDLKINGFNKMFPNTSNFAFINDIKLRFSINVERSILIISLVNGKAVLKIIYN